MGRNRLILKLRAPILFIVGVVSMGAGPLPQAASAAVPNAPSNLRYDPPDPFSVILRWNDNSNNETRFRIAKLDEGEPDQEQYWDNVGGDRPANSTSYRVQGLVPGRRYKFKVRACNSDGCSFYSNVVEVLMPLAVPAAPTNLRSDPPDPFSIILRWNDNSPGPGFPFGENSFNVSQLDEGEDPNNAAHWDQVAQTGAGQVDVRVQNLQPTRHYWFRVRAHNDHGYSDYSNVIEIVTAAAVPATPANLVAFTEGPFSVSLTWDDNSPGPGFPFGEDGFNVSQLDEGEDPNNAGHWDLVAQTGAGQTEILVENLHPDRGYSFRVRARNGYGYSEYSNVASTSTEPAVPAAPTNFHSEELNSFSALLRWEDNSDGQFSEDGFDVSRLQEEGDHQNPAHWDLVARTSVNQTEVIVQNLQPRHFYFFRVQAWNSYGYSDSDFTTVYLCGDALCVTTSTATALRSVLAADIALLRDVPYGAAEIPVVVLLHEARDELAGASTEAVRIPAHERPKFVSKRLRQIAAADRRSFSDWLAAAEQRGLARSIRSLPIANAVAASVSPGLLDDLGLRAEVARVIHDLPQRMIEPRRPLRSQLGAPRARTTREPVIAWGVERIGAPAAWEQGYRGDCVLVGVIDSGVSRQHADLQDRLWNNTVEVPSNGIDDDMNGYVDDTWGYDFVDRDAEPLDGHGHGTHVAGTIAGDGSGGIMTGVAPGAKVMALKVSNDEGQVDLADVLEAMYYAIDQGARVVNMSLGFIRPPTATREALRRATDALAAAGVVTSIAVGNEGDNLCPPNVPRSPGDAPPPWLSDEQPVLGAIGGATSVGATRFEQDAIATFSSIGPVDWSDVLGYADWVLCDGGASTGGLIKPDVSAPGESILSAAIGGGYLNLSGTSMAAPHVAGVAALVISRNRDFTAGEIHRVLETTAVDLGPPGKDNSSGAGRVYAAAAIAAVPPGPSACAPPTDVGAAETSRSRIAIRPNPVRGEATILCTTRRDGPISVAVFDAAGRLVRRVVAPAGPAGMRQLNWDGCDSQGRASANGVYFVEVDFDGQRSRGVLVLVR